MPIAYWRDEYCTGNTDIDSQHQKLFKIINTLYDAMLEGHGKDVLKTTLDELIFYTIEHFTSEEAFMIANQYPTYEAHKAIHQDLTNNVVALSEKFEEDTKFLTVEVSKFLTQWLIHHIKGEDQKMIKFFRNKGPQPFDGNARV